MSGCCCLYCTGEKFDLENEADSNDIAVCSREEPTMGIFFFLDLL